MTELNKNSYLKILEENTDIPKSNIEHIDNPFYSVRHNTILSMDERIVDADSTVVSRIARTASSENLHVSNVSSISRSAHGLPLFYWILARERLINNARVLNNGWTVDWENRYSNQNGRVYLYASNYNSETNTFLIDEAYAVFKHNENGLIFKTRELARQFIEQNQEDLQIYFSL